LDSFWALPPDFSAAPLWWLPAGSGAVVTSARASRLDAPGFYIVLRQEQLCEIHKISQGLEFNTGLCIIYSELS
jgi:hypothetical protein